MTQPTKLYRYFNDTTDPDHIMITLEYYLIVRETPKGFWYMPEWLKNFPPDVQKQHTRWTSSGARVRYCYPTRTQAWQSFLERKRWQEKHLNRQLKVVQQILSACTLEVPDRKDISLHRGKLKSLTSMLWEQP